MGNQFWNPASLSSCSIVEMPSHKGGGSVGQSLKYVDPSAPERSASAGSDLLKESGLIARPAIGGGGCGTRKRKGGFYPSVMKGVVNAGVVLAPLTAVAARRLFSRKQRRGGGKKGNLFRADKEEAKRQLEAVGKPSAANVLAFVAAKRRGSEAAEEYLGQFRKKKQEKNEANEARRRERNTKKAEKAAARAAAREAKKASKKAKKAAEAKPASAESSASTASTASSNSSNNERPPTQAQLRREAEENAARAKAAAKKPLKNSQVAWFSLVENAAKRLATNGLPTRKNAMKYASLLKQGKTEEAEAFLANFRARSRKSNKKPAKKAKTPEAAPSAAAGNNRPAAAAASAAAPKANNAGTKKRKSPSAAQKAYFEALRTARATLGTMGRPKPSNMAKWASLKVSKKNNAPASLARFEQEFRSRVSAAPAAAAKASKKPAKKELTAVAEAKENNNNQNSMQGYSENFESESSNE